MSSSANWSSSLNSDRRSAGKGAVCIGLVSAVESTVADWSAEVHSQVGSAAVLGGSCMDCGPHQAMGRWIVRGTAEFRMLYHELSRNWGRIGEIFRNYDMRA